MRWAGHLIRMGDDRLPRMILFGALAEGSRARGRPPQRLAKYDEDRKLLATALKLKGPEAEFFLTGKVTSQWVLRGQQPVEDRCYESWWTLATSKDKWRACLADAWRRNLCVLVDPSGGQRNVEGVLT